MTQLSMTSYGESSIDLLYPHVAMEALHDSGERFLEPVCHLGTRTATMEMLHSWSTNTSTESTIFHLKRGTWHSLIPTIAYQLATSVTELLLPIQQVVEGDKLIVGRALAISFQALLVEPLKKHSDLQKTPVIMLDGLDECADHKIQQQILRLFIGTIRHHNLRLRLLIVSHPEPHLCEVLETGETFAIYESAYQFSRIHCEFIARGIYLEPEWPSLDTVDQLVRMSSATFIYATIVIHFIDNELNSVLELDPQSTAPLVDLYTQILSVVPQEQEGQQLRKEEDRGRISVDPEEIDILLNLHTGTCHLILRRLHSLFEVPPIQTQFGSWEINKTINFLHASFSDYLSDPRRSKWWCISLPWLDEECIYCLLYLFGYKPPQTYIQQYVYDEVSYHLSDLLSNATPSEALVDLLRNCTVQNYLFLNVYEYDWPEQKRGPPYPPDLVQLWDDLRAVAELQNNLHVSKDPSTATFKYDAIYTELFSRHPELCLILQCEIVTSEDHLYIYHHLPLFGWTGAVYHPFLKFPELFPLPFPDRDSPLDFLADPQRAGRLYLRTFVGGPLFFRNYLQLIEKCRTSQRLLREFATFNLSDLCRQMAIDVGAHENFHEYIVWDGRLHTVLDWLRSFPDDPLLRQVLAFWERQVNVMQLCPSSVKYRFRQTRRYI
ncbi:hypothetical protein DFH08DRAFT_885794 [Mycena albidolilacea]|uniref:Nephrocystin 3-like N-terminal domain-containing protein n=1 Tax=Mycena albidolilacea TaxID=1033008 RepID=A0AAD7EJF9_9AGAR|nr:hypothetical protein DFH08DRAFT_885794 [Mycena albidolilacea]